MAEVTTTQVVMPQMGEALTEATIVTWRKAEGDLVEEDEPLLDISTSKVEVEVPAPASGRIARLLFAEGDTVPVDTVIALLVPGDVDPSTVEIAAPTALGDEEDPGDSDGGTTASGEESEDVEADRLQRKATRSSPLVRKMARELHVDLDRVSGSGAQGRVTRKDLEAYIAHNRPKDPPRIPAFKPAVPAKAPLPPSVPSGAIKLDTVSGPAEASPLLPPEEVTVNHLRRQIADQMVRSVQDIPQAFTVHEVDFTLLERIRLRKKAVFESQFEARLTPLVFVVRAVADALLVCPYINATWAGDRIQLHQNVNIGIAVAVQDGLVVPVLKCVEAMSLAGIARGITELATRARAGQLTLEDMQHATFTLTSPGQLGAVLGIPIVNRPQGGILHFGAIRKVPAVIQGIDGDDTIAIRQRAMLTLGIDHRLIDGWEADRFMVAVKERIERADFELPG